MVGVTAAVIAHSPLHFGRQAVEAGKQLLHRQRRQFGEIGQGGIEVVDISLMVTAVMDLHGQRVDVGFQCVVGIGKGRQGMAHGHLCLL